MSDAGPAFVSATCSGAMYAGEPAKPLIVARVGCAI